MKGVVENKKEVTEKNIQAIVSKVRETFIEYLENSGDDCDISKNDLIGYENSLNDLEKVTSFYLGLYEMTNKYEITKITQSHLEILTKDLGLPCIKLTKDLARSNEKYNNISQEVCKSNEELLISTNVMSTSLKLLFLALSSGVGSFVILKTISYMTNNRVLISYPSLQLIIPTLFTVITIILGVFSVYKKSIKTLKINKNL